MSVSEGKNIYIYDGLGLDMSVSVAVAVMSTMLGDVLGVTGATA